MFDFLNTVIGSQISEYPFLVTVFSLIVVSMLFFMITTCFISLFPQSGKRR